MTQHFSENLRAGKSGQVISDSALNDDLPDKDPRQIEIPTVSAAEINIGRIITESSQYRRLNMPSLMQNQGSIIDNLINFINSRALQFNPRSRSLKYTGLRNAIANSVKVGCPIEIVLPIFCAVGNELKRFNITSITGCEIVTLHSLYNIAELSTGIYQPGVCFKVIADSNFYSTPFSINTVETEHSVAQLRDYIIRNGLDSHLEIVDMVNICRQRPLAFADAYRKWIHKLQHGHCAYTGNEKLAKWRESILSSINLRKHCFDYKTLHAVYSKRSSAIKTDLLRQADSALLEYRALKYAAADIDWKDIYFSNYIRATIHTKNIPSLGLRIYPEYKYRSRLLPYHGVGVFYIDSKTRFYRMEVVPEAQACAISGVKRILGEEGLSFGYVK